MSWEPLGRGLLAALAATIREGCIEALLSGH